MRDSYNYSDGSKWKTLKGSHWTVKVTKAERGWKANSKRRHQYKPVTA